MRKRAFGQQLRQILDVAATAFRESYYAMSLDATCQRMDALDVGAEVLLLQGDGILVFEFANAKACGLNGRDLKVAAGCWCCIGVTTTWQLWAGSTRRYRTP